MYDEQYICINLLPQLETLTGGDETILHKEEEFQGRVISAGPLKVLK